MALPAGGLSTDVFSAKHTGSVLEKVLQLLFGEISSERFYAIHFLVRKTAHFCSYGTLSAFAFFSWRATFPAETVEGSLELPGAAAYIICRQRG